VTWDEFWEGQFPRAKMRAHQSGMINWFVPLSTNAAGYGGNRKVPCHSSVWRHRNRACDGVSAWYRHLNNQTNSSRDAGA